MDTPQVQQASIDTHSLPLALRLLRATVVEPWESVNQVLAEHGDAGLGDSLTAGTGAWHLRHIVEIFRLHAGTVMAALGDAKSAELMTRPSDPIPRNAAWSVRAARDELLADVDVFAAWLLKQPPESLGQSFEYGPSMDLTRMFSVMLQHITWHAAAVHYWRKWKGE